MNNNGIKLAPGTVVRGKWHGKSYVIGKKLGSGALGTVYLASYNGTEVAVKLSHNSTSITSEVNVLKNFQKVRGKNLGPSLIDVDDWEVGSKQRLSFYAMEYLKGKDLLTFIREKGDDWVGIIVMQLLDSLADLHNEGWVFGDLKPENLLVTYPPAKVRWVDVGGTTQIGRAIKEYTEFYDRGFWGMGSRKAEPTYDLFALGMIMLQVDYPNRFERGGDGTRSLWEHLDRATLIRRYKPVVRKALQGEYHTSEEMKRDVMDALMGQNHADPKPTRMNKPKKFTSRSMTSLKTQRTPSSYRWESVGLMSAVGVFYTVYMLLQWL
ncbi:serine/threonine protein kinase [Pontibacillus halophilus JSM 076056 = DSM 19796]|uniref:Serine/threonine protein kinase n=1 Tax=Pontibacillus halophilus JSM 076056 = DSM 19796 TaxID=1385510 RepID=A0A0A5I2J8_9BACI|nr:protein kinase [Pontibacillus halophilus]KGX90067.1 serine/threonine protein kinase [Pontibacillus halophilus JSM 076056 = DSM 19796]